MWKSVAILSLFPRGRGKLLLSVEKCQGDENSWKWKENGKCPAAADTTAIRITESFQQSL